MFYISSCDHSPILRSLPALIKFLAVGATLHLDGFVLELPGDEFGETPQKFGEGVRHILKCISDHDPAGFHCMNKSYVPKIGWSFEFNGVPIFVTTFAPCYPDNHSRYAFGAEGAFVLFQPMYSFAIHDIGEDTPHTNWDNPVTVRDKIRVAYKENNRAYYIRDTVFYPAAHDIVKPLVEGTGKLVEWWKDPNCPENGRGEDGDDEEMFGMMDTEEESEESDSQGMGSENKCPVLSGGDEHPNPMDKKTQ